MKNEFGWESMNCAAHCLQLCVEDGLKVNTIARLLGVAQKLVSHFKHSTVATSALIDRQKRMNMPTKKLLQDCSTRWNSSYYLLERLVEMQWPISAVLSDERVTKKADRYLDLKNEQWDLARELLAPLKQIETATVYMSEEEKASVSSILPILHGIIENINIADEDSVTIKEFKTAITESIEKRWSLDDLCPILHLSTILDTRFKQLKFLQDEQKCSIIDALKSNVEIMADDQDCTMADNLECTIIEQESSQSEMEKTQEVELKDSQAILDEGSIPEAKKLKKKTALDVLLGPEESQETYYSG